MSTEKRPDQMTSAPDLSQKKATGPERSTRPIYLDRLPPCNKACPAGENIQAWLALSQEGKIEEAWRELTRNNPLPAVHGRICYHPCEDACNRSGLDQTISIHAVERFLGDKALEEKWQFKIDAEPTGKKVLVVGAGPSGLSAAYQLAKRGHSVTIKDAAPMGGGMMHFGIPKYRLPRDVLDAEVQRIVDMGVELVLNHKVEDLAKEKAEGGFDAVFVAVGAHLSRRTDIPARDAGAVLDAVQFLKDVETGDTPLLGRKVAIYGGGNTAMDAARTAKRLGAEETLIVYRRNREMMPAHDFEADEAEEEGIKMHWLRTIKKIEGNKMMVEKMALNAEGWPEPTGEVEELEADSLIMALGQNTDTEFLQTLEGIEFKKNGEVIVNEKMMTGAEGIFAGGDMVPCDRTATIGTGHGKKAAYNIDAWLRKDEYNPGEKNEDVSYDQLNIWLYTDAKQREQSAIDVETRKTTFDEVVGGLSEEEAIFEARRCLSCGNCFECDGCYGACPEDAVIKLGPGKRYKYDYSLCTGCSVCFEQCPCAAIKMVPEPQA